MPRRDIPSTLYPPGTRRVELNTIPENSDGARITLTRENWPDGAGIIEIIVSRTEDNRQTWIPHKRIRMDGGVLIGSDGQPRATSWVAFTWPGERDGEGVRHPRRSSDLAFDVTNTVPVQTAITLESF